MVAIDEVNLGAQASAVEQREYLTQQQIEKVTERMRCLMTRNAQLDKQVSDLRESRRGHREDKQALTRQQESISIERAHNRNAHQKARTSLKELQKQVKCREMDIARLNRKQETLQRQALKLQADVNGLKVRI